MGAKSSKHVSKPFTNVRRGQKSTVRIINVMPASPASHLLTSPESNSSASGRAMQMVDAEDVSSNGEIDFFQTYLDDSEDSYAEIHVCSFIT